MGRLPRGGDVIVHRYVDTAHTAQSHSMFAKQADDDWASYDALYARGGTPEEMVEAARQYAIAFAAKLGILPPDSDTEVPENV